MAHFLPTFFNVLCWSGPQLQFDLNVYYSILHSFSILRLWALLQVLAERVILSLWLNTQQLKGYLSPCGHNLIFAVPCQAQTEAVFISHAATDPLACWDAGLVARLAATNRPVTTCLSGCSSYPSVSYLPACVCFPTCLVVSHWQPPCLLVRLLVWVSQCCLFGHLPSSKIFCLYSSLPVSLAAVAVRLFFLLSGRLLSFCLPSCLSGFPAEGCLDRCWITRTPQTHYSYTRKETGRVREQEEAVTDERRDKWRKRREERNREGECVERKKVRGWERMNTEIDVH